MIRVASDLHLEFFQDVPMVDLIGHFLPPDERDRQSVLVLAGDVTPIIDQLQQFFEIVSKRFSRIVYVAGNHEYYYGRYEDWNAKATEALAGIKNLSMCLGGVGVVDISGYRFIFATLWGDGGESARERAAVHAYLHDFRVIGMGDGLFRVSDMQRLHNEQKRDIALELKASTGQCRVVVTHHMPSYKLSHPRFGEDATGGFAGKCDSLMVGAKAPEIWIHGHTHDTIDRVLGETRVVCNPAGYSPEWQSEFNSFFAKPKFI